MIDQVLGVLERVSLEEEWKDGGEETLGVKTSLPFRFGMERVLRVLDCH